MCPIYELVGGWRAPPSLQAGSAQFANCFFYPHPVCRLYEMRPSLHTGSASLQTGSVRKLGPTYVYTRMLTYISVSWVIRNERRIRSGVITSDAGRAGRLARLSLTTLSASNRRALSDGALGVFQLELGEEHQLRKYLCTVFRRTQSSDH